MPDRKTVVKVNFASDNLTRNGHTVGAFSLVNVLMCLMICWDYRKKCTTITLLPCQKAAHITHWGLCLDIFSDEEFTCCHRPLLFCLWFWLVTPCHTSLLVIWTRNFSLYPGGYNNIIGILYLGVIIGCLE